VGDVTSEMAALLMRRAGLDHELFKPEEVAADLTARIRMNDSLDDLLRGSPGLDPTAFDPSWQA
jgi:hypothetical protein